MDDENKDQMTDREKELVDQIANLEQDKANLVDEIKNTKKTKQELEKEYQDKIDSLNKERQELPDQDSDPEQVVNRVLEKKEEAKAKENFDAAKEDFRKSVQEFANDEAGLLYKQFEKDMKKFNFSGLTSKEDFNNRLKEVYEFHTRNRQTQEPSKTPYEGTPSQSGTDPKVTDDAALSAAENKLLRELGWDKDKFLAVKTKRPQYVASLLKYRT